MRSTITTMRPMRRPVMSEKCRAAWTSTPAMLLAAIALMMSARPASGSSWGANYFPNIALTTQDGNTVHFWDDLLQNKRVVINFIYTRCGDSCPLETARMAQVQRILGGLMGRDVFFYSISLDPVRDTPAELKDYAAKFHAGPGWLFLTGRKADIELVRKKLGMAARSNENELTDHSTSLMIGNVAAGQWMRESSLDNPQYIAAIVRDWMSDWKDHKAGTNYADKLPLPDSVADRGAYLFQSRCAACHTIGRGEDLGPDLRGVTARRDRAWLSRFIAEPNLMLAEKDPIAAALFDQYRQLRMPNLRLGDADVKALLGFLESQGKVR